MNVAMLSLRRGEWKVLAHDRLLSAAWLRGWKSAPSSHRSTRRSCGPAARSSACVLARSIVPCTAPTRSVGQGARLASRDPCARNCSSAPVDVHGEQARPGARRVARLAPSFSSSWHRLPCGQPNWMTRSRDVERRAHETPQPSRVGRWCAASHEAKQRAQRLLVRGDDGLGQRLLRLEVVVDVAERHVARDPRRRRAWSGGSPARGAARWLRPTSSARLSAEA